LTGVFPIRLETQEGLIDQLVQIKMYGLPADYLQTYREQLQGVTIEESQRVAMQYLTSDEAAIVIVGDGAEIIEQVTPYTEAIELYNTAGKRKERTSTSSAQAGDETGAGNLAGTWTLDIESPLGQ